MSKGQFKNVGGRRGPDSGFISPEKVTIIEIEDRKHPKHTFYSARLSPKDPEILSLAESFRVVGWQTGSIVWLYRDGQKGAITAAAGRRRITAARIENMRRKAAKDKRGPIEIPYLMTKDPAAAEAIENAGRVDLPPMQKARDFVALQEAFGDEQQAAALLNLSLKDAHDLEWCLKLSLADQGKVNRRELTIDSGARAAKGGQKAAAETIAASKDANGAIDPKRVKAAARKVSGVRAKTLPAHVLARVEAELPIDDGAPAVRHEAEVIRGALALARGDYRAAMGVSVLRAALLRAGYDEQTGRLPTGPRKGAP